MEKLNKLIIEHFKVEKSRNSLSNFIKKIKLDNEIFTFLSKLGFETLKQNYYHYINDIEKPICIICNSDVNWVEKDFKYRETCSSKCSGKLNITRKNSFKVIYPEIKNNIEFIEYFSTGKVKLIRESLIRIYPDIVYNIDKLSIECDTYSEKVFYYLKELKNKPVCYCGNIVKFDSFTKGYHKYCSVKCSSNSIEKKTNIENTCLEKYGVKNIGEITRDKAVNTMIERYGSHISKTEQYKIKFKETSIKNYGVEHPFKSNIIQELIKDTCYKRYGDTYIQQRTNKTLNTKKEKGLIYKWTETELKDIKSYRRSISYYTELEYKKYKSIINPDDIERGLYTNHIDHIYPVIEGWRNKISPKILSSYKNLRLIPSVDNLSKGDRTDLDMDNFLYSIFNI
jgi:hypothetical protein